MRSLILATSSLVAAALLAGCGADGSRSHMAGVDWDATITLTADTVAVEYRITNTQTRPLVVYDRGWVDNGNDPRPVELEARPEDVEIVVDGDVTELGLRIIDTCHGNPNGEISHPDPARLKGCGDDGRRIAASVVGHGEELVRRFELDVDRLVVDHPARLRGTAPDLSTGPLRFCVGVHRTAHPSEDGLYGPSARETVLCARS